MSIAVVDVDELTHLIQGAVLRAFSQQEWRAPKPTLPAPQEDTTVSVVSHPRDPAPTRRARMTPAARRRQAAGLMSFGEAQVAFCIGRKAWTDAIASGALPAQVRSHSSGNKSYVVRKEDAERVFGFKRVGMYGPGF